MPSWDGGDMAWHLLTGFLGVGAVCTLLEQWGLAPLSAAVFLSAGFIHKLPGQWAQGLAPSYGSPKGRHYPCLPETVMAGPATCSWIFLAHVPSAPSWDFRGRAWHLFVDFL